MVLQGEEQLVLLPYEYNVKENCCGVGEGWGGMWLFVGYLSFIT